MLLQFIPVSLYVTMSTAKFAQAYLIEKDLAMYHAESDTPVRPSLAAHR